MTKLLAAAFEKASNMSTPLQKDALNHDTLQQIRVLWENNKMACGWFVRDDFVPRTPEEGLRCLGWLKKHGNRQTYISARKLEKCL